MSQIKDTVIIAVYVDRRMLSHFAKCFASFLAQCSANYQVLQQWQEYNIDEICVPIITRIRFERSEKL